MPNHVVNHLKMEGDPEKIRELMNRIQNDEYGPGTIDFNKIRPMPESLRIEAGSRTDKGLKAYRDFIEVYTLGGTTNMDLRNIPEAAEKAFLKQRKDIRPDEWELGRQAFRNIQEYGAPTWYEWCIANWGTKWNAYGYEPGTDYSRNGGIYMQTAWNAPHPVIAELAKQNPDIHFMHSWADEQLGQGCGQHEYYNGERTSEYYPRSNKDSIDFAAFQWDADPADWGYTLNATGNAYITTNVEKFQLTSVCDQPALFTSERLTAEDVPKGLYCYHLRESDTDGSFASIGHKVDVNFGGTIITGEPLDFRDKMYIPLDGKSSPHFFGGEDLSFDQFMRGGFDGDMSEDEAGGDMKLEMH